MTRPLVEVADVARQYGADYLAHYGAVTSTALSRASTRVNKSNARRVSTPGPPPTGPASRGVGRKSGHVSTVLDRPLPTLPTSPTY